MAAVLKPQDPDELKEARDKWVARLDDEQKAHKQYRDLAKDATDEYFAVACPDNDAVSSVSVAYPLFWSIVNVLHGRIFSQPPSPDVRKRNPDEPGLQPLAPPQQAFPQADAALAGLPPGAQGGNPVPPGPPQPGQPPAGMGGAPGQPPTPPPVTVDDNKISQLLERALQWVIDVTNFDADSHAAVNDLLVEGAGIAKIEIDVETQEIPVTDPTTGEELNEQDDDGNDVLDDEGNPKPQMQSVITDQSLRLRHFAFERQFRWEPHQHWSTVSWVAFMHGMTADEIEDEWGIQLSNEGGSSKRHGDVAGGYGTDDKKPEADKYERLFDVYEVWDKATREVIFVCPNHDEAFEIRPDPLKLKDFFPCPKPMMLNIRGDDLVPQPDYSKCESLFKTANHLYARIDGLTRQIKDIGFYDGAFTELADFMTEKDGALIPISNLLKRLNDINPGNAQLGFDAVVMKQDNAEKVKTLQLLVQQLAEIEDMIWKSYGVSDIQRGSTNPDETATAQNIKAQWADIRVGQRIRIVALFFRDVFRIMADILSTFTPEVLFKMTGITLNPAEQAVLTSDVGRCYAIDVESDSTVVQDQAAVQAERTQMLQAVTGYLKEIGPMMQQNMIPGDLGKELLLFVVNTYKSGRQIEDAINNLPGTMQQLTQQQTTISQLQQQMQNLIKQNQAQSKALGAINQGQEQRANVETAIKAQKAPVENAKTQADTEHTQVLTAKEAEGVQGAAIENAQKRVFPFPVK
jgi:hypothetical protein